MTEEQRAERIHHHLYETCEGIREHAERIVRLEELISDIHAHFYESGGWKAAIMNAACELCESDNGGESPCARSSSDLSESHCDAYTQQVIEARMGELGIEVQL